MKKPLLWLAFLLAFAGLAWLVFTAPRTPSQSDLTFSFVGWTNIVRPNDGLTSYIAYGPCAIVGITNANQSHTIGRFDGRSVESLVNGEWITIQSRRTSSPFLTGGLEWYSGFGTHIPLRLVENLPAGEPWRLEFSYHYQASPALDLIDKWFAWLPGMERGDFHTPQTYVFRTPPFPPPNECPYFESSDSIEYAAGQPDSGPIH